MKAFSRPRGLTIFGRRHARIHHGVLFVISNLLFAAGCLFAAEVALIVAGVKGLYLPLGHRSLGLLGRLFF